MTSKIALAINEYRARARRFVALSRRHRSGMLIRKLMSMAVDLRCARLSRVRFGCMGRGFARDLDIASGRSWDWGCFFCSRLRGRPVYCGVYPAEMESSPSSCSSTRAWSTRTAAHRVPAMASAVIEANSTGIPHCAAMKPPIGPATAIVP